MLRVHGGILLALVWAAGCSSSQGDRDGSTDLGGDAPTDNPSVDASQPEAGLDVPTGDSGPRTDAGPLLSITLPQAVAGAMFANPVAYPQIPLHVQAAGRARAVSVRLGTAMPVAASDPDGDGDWVASLRIADLVDGMVAVEATADGEMGAHQTASGQLVIGRTGVQLTDHAMVGMAGVPRLHRKGAEAWLTWTDRSQDHHANAWLRRLDGGGRWVGDRVALVRATDETLYARTAVGRSSLGVLYQSPGSPYVNHFTVVGPDGTQLMAPIDLDPTGWRGSFGGDVEHDGSGYVLVWRSRGPASSEIRWMRVADGSWAVTGPITVAASGPGSALEPDGDFDAFSFLDVAAVGDRSLVGFVRHRWINALELTIPKSQLALLRADGTVAYRDFVDGPSTFTFHSECRTFPTADRFVAVWARTDLNSPLDEPPNQFFATRTGVDGALDPARGEGTLMSDPPDDRGEPFLLAPHGLPGLMMWFDHRAYTLTPDHGRIELYAAEVGEDLGASGEVVFTHARCVAGTSMLHAAPAGTNALMVWIDERHGLGIVDPRPEVYFETAWR